MSYRFKLLLFPESDVAQRVPLPKLPKYKSIVDVYSDFYAFLLLATSTEVRKAYDDTTWRTLSENLDFILTHPRGWGLEKHEIMRKAAVAAKRVISSLVSVC